jgi:hypothetical protein
MDSEDECEETAVAALLPPVAVPPKVASHEERLRDVRMILGIDNDLMPILPVKEMSRKIRFLPIPENDKRNTRNGRMAADIEYSIDNVEMDNRCLDEKLYRAWQKGAQFGIIEKKTRKVNQRTNHSKVCKEKKEEIMRKDGLTDLETSHQKEVVRTMALKRREMATNSYVIAKPGVYPRSAFHWMRKSLKRTAVANTRKTEKLVCDDCKNRFKKGNLYDDEGYKVAKLTPEWSCGHVEPGQKDFAYGHQTDRLSFIRFGRAESMSWVNLKLMADYRHSMRQNTEGVVTDNPFGLYFQPASLLKDDGFYASFYESFATDNLAVVGSLSDGFTLFPRRIFSGSFYEAMKKVAKGHLDGTFQIDDVVGATEFLSGDVERVCNWIVYSDQYWKIAQTAIWWAIGLCEYVSSTIAGRELLKQCGMTSFDRELCNLLYDYARCEINRREKKNPKKKKQKVVASSSVKHEMLSESANVDEDEESDHSNGSDEDDNNEDDNDDNDDNYDNADSDKIGGRGGNSSDPYRSFLWWIEVNRDINNSTLLKTVVSDSSWQHEQAHVDQFELQIESLSTDHALAIVSDEHVRGLCAGFNVIQTRIYGMLCNQYTDGHKTLRPLPSVYARTIETIGEKVNVQSTLRVDNEEKYSGVFLCKVAQRLPNMAVLHTSAVTPVSEKEDEKLDSVYASYVADEARRRLQMETMRQQLERVDDTVTARGVNNRNEHVDSSHMQEARLSRICGSRLSQPHNITETLERPASFIVFRMILLDSEKDKEIVEDMKKTPPTVDGVQLSTAKNDLSETTLFPNSALGVSITTIRMIEDTYSCHHRGKSLALAGHVEWGQPLTSFDQLCKNPPEAKNPCTSRLLWEEYSSHCYEKTAKGKGKGKRTLESEDDKEEIYKPGRRGGSNSTATLSKTTPPSCLMYNDVRIERIGESKTELFNRNGKNTTRMHASYAVTVQIPMQNAQRLVDLLPKFKQVDGVSARHVLNMLHVGTIKALDTNETAKERNAGEKDVMRRNARGAPVNDCNTEISCSVEEIYYGGINNLSQMFTKTHYQGCYEWVPHGSGPKGSDASNFLSDNRKSGRSLHEAETSADIYAIQRDDYFKQVGGDSSLQFETRPDDFKFWPFANAAGVSKSLNTYYHAKGMMESIAPLDKTLLPVLLAMPLSPDTQSIAPLVNPGLFDCGSKLSMSTPRVQDFNPFGRADNVNATDELFALLNPELFRPPSSQSSVDMCKTDTTEYGSTWKALHFEVARITKELAPNYEREGVEALRTLVLKYHNGDDLPSDQRVIASTILVLLNLCNSRVFEVNKPVIVRMYAIVAAITAWEDANGKTTEYGTLSYWRHHLSPAEVAEEKTFFDGYFKNGSHGRGAWNSIAPLYDAILKRDGSHFQSYEDFFKFEGLFTEALRQSVWFASSEDGIKSPESIEGGPLHPLENLKGPHEIRRRHLEPAFVGRYVARSNGSRYIDTRGATFGVESFQAVQILTLLNSASSIPLFDPQHMLGYGVQVYRNTGGLNVRISTDSNIKFWDKDPKTGKKGWVWRTSKSTSIDQVDHDTIWNGEIQDRRESHALQRIAANHNTRALATTVSILNKPLSEQERKRGAEIELDTYKMPTKSYIEDFKTAVTHPHNLQSVECL